jgi:hypothetical protein
MQDHGPLAPIDPPLGENRPGPIKRKKDSPQLLALIGLALLALGGGALYRIVSDAWQGLASRNWSKAEGTVLKSDLEHAYSARGGNQYSRKVSYRYTIGGQAYQSDRISFHETWDGGDEATHRSKLDSTYPVGKVITVYCNPKDPSISCLEIGPNWFILILGSIMSLLFLGIGFLLTKGGMSAWAHSQGQHRK